MRSHHLAGVVLAMLPLAVLPVEGRAGRSAPQVTSYFQLRGTDREGDDPYLSLRRLKLMVSGALGEREGYYAQLLYKANNGSRTD